MADTSVYDPALNAPRMMSVDDLDGSPRALDVVGRQKVSIHQNIYEADFEYGKQSLRWDELVVGGGSSITHLPGLGGVRMRLAANIGDITIRQSRPYHRYQPGKTMFMASAVNFGVATAGQVQRVGFFDDSNGVFLEQADPTAGANPFGMFVVVRSDSTGGAGVVNDMRIPFDQWDSSTLPAVKTIDWTRIQMMFIEYAWYGAGALRWGVFINGRPVILHQIGMGNRAGQTAAWARTGNLPVRYEQRNVSSATANDMIHYGVSVMVEGRSDDQRGFTYAYGTPWNATSATAGRRQLVIGSGTNANRVPVVSVRGRTMGTQEYTQATTAATAGSTTTLTSGTAAWTVDQWRGRFVAYVNTGVTYVARIMSNTATVLTFADPVTGGVMAAAAVAGQNYTIGMVNRGQILPRRLQVTSDQSVFVELVVSTPTSPVVLTGATFAANSAAANSFALIDSAATAATGGELVYSIFVPANTAVDQVIDNLFPLVNTIRGAATDILSVLVTNTSATTAANVSVQIIGQEAMS